MDNTLKIIELEKQELKVGDKIKAVDGSTFSYKDTGGKAYIVSKDVTTDLEIGDIVGEVVEIDVKGHIITFANRYYIQDTVVKIAGVEYRINSSHLMKV